MRALVPQMVDGGPWRGAEQEVGIDREVERWERLEQAHQGSWDKDEIEEVKESNSHLWPPGIYGFSGHYL